MSLPMFAGILGVGIGVLLFVYHYYGNQQQNSNSNHRYDYHPGQDNPPPPPGYSSQPTSGGRKRRLSRNNDKNDCIICLEPFSNKNCQFTYCLHRFHVDCLTEWRKHSTVCPICRYNLNVS